MNAVEVTSRRNRHIKIQTVSGHFATSHAHVDTYINLNDIRTNQNMAMIAAEELAKQYAYSIPVDTIVCLESTQMMGAFIAYQLSSRGMRSLSQNISVVTPEVNSNNQLMFNDDTQKLIQDKRVLLSISTASTGRSLNRAAECLSYYGGNLVGIVAIFSAIDKLNDIPVNSLFSPKDVPGYNSYQSGDCPMCKAGRKLDGFITVGGYTKI